MCLKIEHDTFREVHFTVNKTLVARMEENNEATYELLLSLRARLDRSKPSDDDEEPSQAAVPPRARLDSVLSRQSSVRVDRLRDEIVIPAVDSELIARNIRNRGRTGLSQGGGAGTNLRLKIERSITFLEFSFFLSIIS
jgi:hypothetical protein